MTSPLTRERAVSVSLPTSGPISRFVAGILQTPVDEAPPVDGMIETAHELIGEVEDPLADDDFQLGLYLCYELHYRGHPGVEPSWEWEPALLSFRGELEKRFFHAISESVPAAGTVNPVEVGDLLFELEAADDGVSLSRHIELHADIDQFREFVAHRSLYQLKEADPHSWAIPRLTGAAKSALLEVQSDEYGGGRADRIHSTLFAKTMRALGLSDQENAYLHLIPGTTIATVNLMTGCGLHRSRRGMIVGHLAMFEMTSTLPNRRYGNALRRLGFDEEATDFYDEHVEADAVHENIAAFDLAGGLARQEPELASDIIFGAKALLHLEDRFARQVLDAWQQGKSSLLGAL